MTSQTKLVIFGITGDLAKRKLLPALARLQELGNLNNTEIIGVSRREVNIDELLSGLGDKPGAADIRLKTRVVSMDLMSTDDYDRLKSEINASSDDRVIIYLSVPPLTSAHIAEMLGRVGLNTPNVHLLLEKPFGVSLQSANESIALIDKYFDNLQVYRIDHYLAKEMAQNIVAFRGGNALFSAIWNNQAIEKIEVVALETIGIEGRAEFYEQTGALRDVLQGHLMQLLTLAIMDVPQDFNWDELPRLRRRALEQFVPADPSKSCRAQYATYRDEVGNFDSQVETFVSVELESHDPAWRGVPMHLITGKGLNEKTTEVRVYLKKQHEAQSNRIILRIQPGEGIEIELFTKKPGYDREFELQTLKYEHSVDAQMPDAYEQVIIDAMRGNKSLFTDSSEVLRSWEVLQPIQDMWDAGESQLGAYNMGDDPQAIIALSSAS